MDDETFNEISHKLGFLSFEESQALCNKWVEEIDNDAMARFQQDVFEDDVVIQTVSFLLGRHVNAPLMRATHPEAWLALRIITFRAYSLGLGTEEQVTAKHREENPTGVTR